MSGSTGQLAERPMLGIGLRVLSGLLFAVMVVCVKAVSTEVPLGQIVFFRSAFALIPLIVFLAMRNEFPGGLRTRRPGGHLLRSGLGAIAMFTSFACVARLPMAEAALVGYLAPIFMATAGVLLLSERPTLWRIGGVVLGFCGVLALFAPELGQAEMDERRLAGFALGIATAVLTAFTLTLVRSLNRTESPGAIAFWFVIACALCGLATMPWGWVKPDSAALLLLVLSGLFGGAAHIAMTLGFRHAEVSRLAPFEYVALIWPIIGDVLIFKLSISPGFVLALPLVLAGAAFAVMEGSAKPKWKSPAAKDN
ncbi:MAG: DMT family transporter [Phyllobacteriaceae bacterium]|nr:DMT family transporter [Phyllobacteriaceae bacterium]